MRGRGLSEETLKDDLRKWRRKHINKREQFRKICKAFSLGGYFSYAFIYGSWEVIRARKVGTTRSKVDYVVYRLFYPVSLLGILLFSIVQEDNLPKFFSLLEVWNMILHISYAFLFLQNCLEHNVYQESVKRRQIIPEKLVVTDEIERGGQKFYICKRYSILPTERLNGTEKTIYLLFNVVITINVGNALFALVKSHRKLKLSTIFFGGMAYLDVLLCPIPVRLAHVVYPVMYYIIYLIHAYHITTKNHIVLYANLNFHDETRTPWNGILSNIFVFTIVHIIITLTAALRDFIISLLDASRNSKQIRNLRMQKRLARRKIMNYVEGPDGKLVGIVLEKRTFVPREDEFIQTDRDMQEYSEADSSFSSIMDRDGNYKKRSHSPTGSILSITSSININEKKIQPAPKKKTVRHVKEIRFSSSSNEEIRKSRELEAIKHIRLPSPPKVTKEPDKNVKEEVTSKIPVPIRRKIEVPLNWEFDSVMRI